MQTPRVLEIIKEEEEEEEISSLVVQAMVHVDGQNNETEEAENEIEEENDNKNDANEEWRLFSYTEKNDVFNYYVFICVISRNNSVISKLIHFR